MLDRPVICRKVSSDKAFVNKTMKSYFFYLSILVGFLINFFLFNFHIIMLSRLTSISFKTILFITWENIVSLSIHFSKICCFAYV